MQMLLVRLSTAVAAVSRAGGAGLNVPAEVDILAETLSG